MSASNLRDIAAVHVFYTLISIFISQILQADAAVAANFNNNLEGGLFHYNAVGNLFFPF